MWSALSGMEQEVWNDRVCMRTKVNGCQALRCLEKSPAPSRWLKVILTDLTRREPADSFTGRGAAGIIRAGY